MMSVGCCLAWVGSLKLHLLRIMNVSKGVERNSFCNMHRQCFRNISKPHISSVNDFIATEILSNLDS